MSRAAGFSHSDETKKKMRLAALGRKISVEQRVSISNSLSGRKLPADVRRKISNALQGRKKTEEHIGKIVSANRLAQRKPLSAEHRMKLSMALKGRRRPGHVVEKILANWSPGRRVSYKGTEFKSTYEVRMAKAFDALGIPWEYEKHRFDLEGTSYTPDFYLPCQDVFYETKGYLGQEGMKKVVALRNRRPDLSIVVATLGVIKQFESVIRYKGA